MATTKANRSKKPQALPAFEVDKVGLAKLLERRGKEFALTELIQNAWDEAAGRVVVTLERADDGLSLLRVEDDNPEGFADLSHAYTLFAESEKKGNVKQRGRFNLGEKLVIAACETASITTTKGTVEFRGADRFMTDAGRDAGSVFEGRIKLTKAERDAAVRIARTLIPPKGVTTVINGVELEQRVPLATFDVKLRTEISDAEGRLRPTTRKTTVSVFEPRAGETPALYELGIPVVETHDRFHVDIGQKVPLNTDRDNVPPGYLRDVRVAVLNNTAHLLDGEEAAASWIADAIEDEEIAPDAINHVLGARFGEQRVAYDPSDHEGTKIAVSQGYEVVGAGAFSKPAWDHIKAAGALLPAGQVTPSVKPDQVPEEQYMKPEHYPEVVADVVAYSRNLGKLLLGVDVNVRVCNAAAANYVATFGGRALTLNYGRLGYTFFERAATDPKRDQQLNALLIHEFAHHTAPDHLSERFHDACCKLGAKLATVALDGPNLLDDYKGN